MTATPPTGCASSSLASPARETPSAVEIMDAMAERGYTGALIAYPRHRWGAAFIREDLVPASGHPAVGIEPASRMFMAPTAASAAAKAARGILAPAYCPPASG